MAESIEDARKCPDCGQTIRKDASFCRHCGCSFKPRKSPRSPHESAPTTSPVPASAPHASGSKQGMMLTLFIVLCICIISVFSVYVASNQGDLGERADREFRSQVRQSLSAAGWEGEVTATNGMCTVTLRDEVPQGIAESLARMTAGIYSHVRRRYNAEPEVSVEVISQGKRVAEASSSSGNVDWRVELRSLANQTQEAAKQRAGQ